MSPDTTSLLMLLYCVAVASIYLTVRLSWLHVWPAFVLGVVTNTLLSLVLTLTQNIAPLQALGSSLLLGIGLSAGSVLAGIVFRIAASDINAIVIPDTADIKHARL